MRYSAVITSAAEIDLTGIFEWYENKRIGLGYDFLLQVDSGLRSLEDNPQIYKEQYKRVRRYLVRRFPYKIFYRIEGMNIVVLAVVYSGRDPEWIKKRISNT
jgi:plasmid stabilization system protein ParE